MIPNKITFQKGQMATIQPPAPAKKTFTISAIDFENPSLHWIDDPNAKTVSISHVNLPAQIAIMGAGTKTAYNPAWTEDDARTALLTQLELPIPAGSATAPTPIAPAPEVEPVHPAHSAQQVD